MRTRVELTGQNWIILGKASDRYRYVLTVKAYPFEQRVLRIPRPKTLQEFRDLWDSLATGNLLRVPKKTTDYFYDLGGPDYIAPFLGEVKKDNPGVGTTLFAQLGLPSQRVRDNLNELGPGQNYDICYFVVDYRNSPRGKVQHTDPIGFFTVADFLDFPFDAQPFLIDRFPKGRQPKPGSFEQSFRILNDLTQNYQSAEITELESILKSEQKRTGESFEAFGIRFPAQGTTRWGMLVVLGIQLYLLIHLRELVGKLRANDPGWDVAWIGVYRSVLSKTVFVLSAFVLPLSAVVALGIRGLYLSDFGGSYWSILCLGSGASAGIALYSWKYSRELHE